MEELNLNDHVVEDVEQEAFEISKQKGNAWVMLRFSVCILSLTLGIMEAADAFMGFAVSLFVLLLGVLLFFILLTIMKEGEAQYRKVKKFTWSCVLLFPAYLIFHFMLIKGVFIS